MFVDIMIGCPACQIHYTAKSIGSPPSNETFDNFSHFMSTNLNV